MALASGRYERSDQVRGQQHVLVERDLTELTREAVGARAVRAVRNGSDGNRRGNDECDSPSAIGAGHGTPFSIDPRMEAPMPHASLKRDSRSFARRKLRTHHRSTRTIEDLARAWPAGFVAATCRRSAYRHRAGRADSDVLLRAESLPVSFPAVSKPDRWRARPGAGETCQVLPTRGLPLMTASLVPNHCCAHGDRRDGRRDVPLQPSATRRARSARSCVGVRHSRSSAEFPWPNRQRGFPTRGDAQGTGSTENRERAPATTRFGTTTLSRTGPVPARSALSRTTRRASFLSQTATASAPCIATCGRDTPTRESSLDPCHLPEAPGRSATPSLLSSPSTHSATAFPWPSIAIRGCATAASAADTSERSHVPLEARAAALIPVGATHRATASPTSSIATSSSAAAPFFIGPISSSPLQIPSRDPKTPCAVVGPAGSPLAQTTTTSPASSAAIRRPSLGGPADPVSAAGGFQRPRVRSPRAAQTTPLSSTHVTMAAPSGNAWTSGPLAMPQAGPESLVAGPQPPVCTDRIATIARSAAPGIDSSQTATASPAASRAMWCALIDALTPTRRSARETSPKGHGERRPGERGLPDVVHPENGRVSVSVDRRRLVRRTARYRAARSPSALAMRSTLERTGRLDDGDAREQRRRRGRTVRSHFVVPDDERVARAVRGQLRPEAPIARRDLDRRAPGRRTRRRRPEHKAGRHQEREHNAGHLRRTRTTTLRENVGEDTPHSSSTIVA